MKSEFRITGKNLGYVMLADYCARCLWYKLQFRFHPPFSGFGGAVWGWLEKMQRATVHHLLDCDGCLPKEFGPLANLRRKIEFPRHWSKFGYLHPSGVYLYGVPDDIFELEDGSIAVVDYKSAQIRGEDDPYFPQYRVQVTAYSNIAEYGLNLGESNLGALMYWEALHADLIADPGKYYAKGTISPKWKVGVSPIEIDYSILDPALKEVVDVWDSSTPPEGESKCENCEKLAALFAIQTEIDTKDMELLRRYRFVPDVSASIQARIFSRKHTLLDALVHLRGLGAMDQADCLMEEPVWDFTGRK